MQSRTYISLAGVSCPHLDLQFDNLQFLDLSNCLLTACPPLSKIPTLEKLYLTYNSISALPKDISKLTQLHELCVAYNNLDVFPFMEIVKLTSLQLLDLSGNNIASLELRFENYEALAKLTALQSLNLALNHITKVPIRFFINLTSLTRLDLSYNEINEFPTALLFSENITHLDISGNILQSVPRHLHLVNLETFDISANALSEISPKILNLEKLTALNLSFNRFTGYPRFLHRLKNLQEIIANTNNDDKIATIIKPKVQPMEFSDDEIPYFHKKFVFIGSSGCGRSSLINLLFSQDSNSSLAKLQLQQYDDVNIFQNLVCKIGNRNVRASVWEFPAKWGKNRKLLHYFASDAIIFLVYNMSKGIDEEQVDFLLQIIVENAPKATVVLVGTHRDISKKQERNTQFIKRYIQSKNEDGGSLFWRVEEAFSVSCKTFQHIARVKNFIARNATQVVHGKLLSLLEMLASHQEAHNEPFISWTKFCEFVRFCQIRNAECETLILRLSDMGLAMYVRNKDMLKLSAQVLPLNFPKVLWAECDDRVFHREEVIPPPPCIRLQDISGYHLLGAGLLGNIYKFTAPAAGSLQRSNSSPNNNNLRLSNTKFNTFAVQVFDISAFKNSEEKLNALLRKLEAIEVLSDRGRDSNIAKVFKPLVRGSTLCIFSEHTGRTLQDLIREKAAQNSRFDVHEIAIIMRDVCIAMKFLHSNNYVHGNLLSENVTISKTGLAAKLSDCWAYKLRELTELGKQLAIVNQVNVEGSMGVAPEINEKKVVLATKSSDVWAMGILLYEMMALQRPEKDTFVFVAQDTPSFGKLLINKLTQKLKADPSNSTNAGPISAGKKALSIFYGILEKCLMFDPVSRISADDVVFYLDYVLEDKRKYTI